MATGSETFDVPLIEPELQENLEAKYCHARHTGCPSAYALCGAFKPFIHSPGQIVNSGEKMVGQICDTCSKEICPVCILADVRPCPQCGGGMKDV